NLERENPPPSDRSPIRPLTYFTRLGKRLAQDLTKTGTEPSVPKGGGGIPRLRQTFSPAGAPPRVPPAPSRHTSPGSWPGKPWPAPGPWRRKPRGRPRSFWDPESRWVHLGSSRVP